MRTVFALLLLVGVATANDEKLLPLPATKGDTGYIGSDVINVVSVIDKTSFVGKFFKSYALNEPTPKDPRKERPVYAIIRVDTEKLSDGAGYKVPEIVWECIGTEKYKGTTYFVVQPKPRAKEPASKSKK